MDKLKLHAPDKARENFEKLAELFPNAVTETIVDSVPRGPPPQLQIFLVGLHPHQ